MLRSLVLSAAAAGLAAGLFTAALQQVTTTPLILEAERYEAAAVQHSAAVTGRGIIATHGHATHERGAPAEAAPAEARLRRTAGTALATVVLGIGFALSLLAAMVLANRRIDGCTGLAFGAAGFTAVALAPALGLPPEIPGSAAADLAGRQAWWLFTAGATAAGLAALLLGRHAALQAAGLALIAIPHVIGAPHPAAYASTAPAELAGRFAATSLVVSAVFWAALGFAAGFVHERLARTG